jgi:uncharacterized protein HemY
VPHVRPPFRPGATFILGLVTGLASALVVVMAVYNGRHRLAKASATYRLWKDRRRRERIAGQQLEALLSIHGVQDPEALAAVQAVVGYCR